MITRITRILLVLQTVAAIGLFMLALKVWHIDNPTLALTLSIGLVVFLRLLITANNFFLAWLYRSETPALHRLSWHQACRLFAREFSATMLSSSWTMAFHSFDKRPAADPTGLPVLLIHGYGCNSGYWHSLSKLLVQAQITHHAIDLEPVLAAIDRYVPAVQRAVETLCNESGHDKIILVAHSMGGLAARAYLRDHGSARIAKVITLGTPHGGTALANFGIGANSKQMRWSRYTRNEMPGDWLRQLEQSESKAIRALFVSIYSHHDNIVSPQISSYLPGAVNLEFHGIGHVTLAFNPAIQARVLAEIRATWQPLSALPSPASA